MSKLLIINTGIELSEFEKYIELLKSNGVLIDVVDLKNAEIADCIKCGKCIKKNECVQDETIRKISKGIQEYAGVIIATEVLFGHVSEKCEHVMTKLMNSASNLFSHRLLLPLYNNRSVSLEDAQMEMARYISQAGGILLTSWLEAEVHDGEHMEYAVKELLWMLGSLNEIPDDRYPRKLNFTR